nr:syncytin-2-like [Cavia porcellus]
MTCLQGSLQNDSTLIDMGHLLSTACVQFVNHTGPMSPLTGHIFVCGNNRAYTHIQTASLLPDIDIVSGDQPVPVPTLDYIAGRQKRVITLIPLLVGMGITGAVATGTAGLAIALDKYADLSNQLSKDVQALSFTIKLSKIN